MIMLKYADYPGKYHGFNLKPGFYYGIDTKTKEYVAASGRENNGEAAIYYRHGKKWIMKWIPAEDIHVSNLPRINVYDKMSFIEWLKAERVISWPDWDENYSQIAMAQIEKEYDLYYYSGLPAFVQKSLQEKNQTAADRYIHLFDWRGWTPLPVPYLPLSFGKDARENDGKD